MNVHHIGYLVKNIEESRRFFLNLGFEVERSKGYDEVRDIFVEFLKDKDYRIELVEPASDSSMLYSALKRFRNVPYHICYETDNIELKIHELVGENFCLTQPPEIAPCIDNQKIAFLQHPHIGIIELLERR